MITHHFGGGVYVKETAIRAGQILVQHKHKFSHLSILAKGAVILMVDGALSRHLAPICIEIAADKNHSIRALTDVVWYCIHATNETDIDRIDQSLITPSIAAELQECLDAMK